MTRLIFDFPSDDGGPARTLLTDPVRVVTARTVREVRPALAAVEQGVAGGLTAAGFVAYEAAPAFEPRMRVRPGGRLPLLWFGLFDLPARSSGPRAGTGTAAPAGTGTDGPAGTGTDAPAPAGAWRPGTDRAAHAAAVARIREEIAAGRTYQVNFTTRLRGPFDGDPLALYEAMRRGQGAGYHAFLDVGSFAIASASPELFFATRGREITTRPMKGTRPRGRWAAEDGALRDQLSGSAKDRSENLMIVDLLRNDLGRVAVTGSVRVPRLLDIEAYRTVWQMTSTVSGTLRDDVGLDDIFAALFPCGSVTGAPKISTMEVVAELEDSPREVYCGAIGLVRPGGDATFNVPIRTAWIDRDRGTAEYGAGGGVVWDSSAEGEYDELLAKALVVRSPWPPFRLLETMRLEEGRIPRLDRHLARMRDSAHRFGMPFPDDAIAGRLETLRRDRPAGAHRVRLELHEDGRVDVSADALDQPWLHAAPTGPEAPATPRPVALAREPVSSADLFLFHKTTRRETYDRALDHAPPGAWDVLLFNQDHELTELTRGNLVVDIDGRLLTPRLAAGLLPGCLRQEALEAGAIAEARLHVADLSRARRAWSINSLRGWVPLTLPPPPAAPGTPDAARCSSG